MDFIPVNEPLLDGNEKKYLNECIDTGWISSEGPFVKKFEDQFSSTVGRKFGIAVANGSVALDTTVTALGIGKGDEVIMPTFTIISCAAAVVRAGAVPVVVDCESHTWNMDVNLIEARITSKTKAIMVVHIYGLPVDMDPVLALAEKYGLMIIEDAAEMHGQTYKGRRAEGRGQEKIDVGSQRTEDGGQRAKGRPCGSFGDISIFSFYPNKLITTGEGGMIATDDDKTADQCRSLRNLCFKKEKRFVHSELGWNFRMSNIQAALGVAQLERLDDSIAKKKYFGQRYNELLSDIPGIQLPCPKTDYAENIYWVYGIVLDENMPFDAIEAMRRLAKQKVGTRPFFWPMHEQPVFRKMGLFGNVTCPVAERIARKGFYIPSGLALNDNQIKKVATEIRKVLI